MARPIRTIKHDGLTWIRYQDYTEEVKELTEKLETEKAFNYVATQVADNFLIMFEDLQDCVVDTFGNEIYNLTYEQLAALNKMQLEGPPGMKDTYEGFESMRVKNGIIIFIINKNLLFTISPSGTIVKQSAVML